MKRACIIALMISCLLLSGCGSKKLEKNYENFASELTGKDRLSFTAQLRAEYEDKTVDFTLDYSQDDSGCTVTIVEPQLISGITARISAENTALEYDGVLISIGDLDPYGLSPMSALPKLVETMKNGFLESVAQESGEIVYQLVLDDHFSASVWFKEGIMVPVHAELVSDGRVRVYCDIKNWS